MPGKKIIHPVVFVVVLFSVFLSQADAQPDVLQKVRQWRFAFQEKKIDANDGPAWQKRFDEIDQQVNSVSDQDDKRLLKLAKALFFHDLGKNEEALQILTELGKEKSNIAEYIHYFIGDIYFSQSKFKEAKSQFEAVLELSPNSKMQVDSQSQLAKIFLLEKNFKNAKNILTKLEKRQRREDGYAETIYNLSLAEKGSNNYGPFCKWIKKLYTNFPQYSKIIDWGPNLSSDVFEGSPTRCAVTNEDRRKRVKNLQWAGFNDKAYQEINTLRSQVKGEEKYQVDRLEVSYWLHDGEITKAMELLMPYYESHKNDIAYLNLLGNATARAGEAQASIGTNYRIYKLAPRGKWGKQALYQAAFLSYQFQDYDGASRKFKEFVKVYPNSGLSRDAQWHLAWIRYLRADYQGALKAFSDINKNNGRSRRRQSAFPKDRLNYWTAMCYYRLENYGAAKSLFDSLSKDQTLGYYSIAANYRLKKIEQRLPKNIAKQSSNGLNEGLRPLSRFSSVETSLPSEDVLAASEPPTTEELENEESLAKQINKSVEDVSNGEEEAAQNPDNPDQDTTATNEDSTAESDTLSEENKPSFSNPVLVKRFERARELMMIGLNDWAKWDLFDIERKTSNKEYLKNLMQEYTTVENYNRSAYIAQVNFGAQRAMHGIEGVRYLWEYAFPKAYNPFVSKYSQSANVEPELIWGIMRAESTYKKDVISPVGALGLMQVMPSTGIKVAQSIRESDFVPRKLLEPDTAIRIGAYYLKRLEKKFNGYIPLVAAAYNAGPHRVTSWLSQFGNLEVDEFVEHIPFLETRNYVKRVSSYFHTYSVLYSNKRDSLSYLSEALKIELPEKVVSKEVWEE